MLDPVVVCGVSGKVSVPAHSSTAIRWFRADPAKWSPVRRARLSAKYSQARLPHTLPRNIRSYITTCPEWSVWRVHAGTRSPICRRRRRQDRDNSVPRGQIGSYAVSGPGTADWTPERPRSPARCDRRPCPLDRVYSVERRESFCCVKPRLHVRKGCCRNVLVGR